MTETGAAALEARIAEGGGDCDDRGTLAHYYQRRQFVDESAPARREAHLLWLARHCPERDHSILLSFVDEPPAAILEIWQAQVAAHPTDPYVLGNAAVLHLHHDNDAALALYARAEAADPTNPDWPHHQAHALSLRARFEEVPRDSDAAAAYAKLRRAAELSSDQRRFDILAELAEYAWDARDDAAARAYADEALARISTMPRSWNTGNLIHDAHAILGRIALADGDVAAARAHLIEAGKTPGSPQLDSFGPELFLAAELLAIGEHVTVLAYLDLCAVFWKGSRDLDRWREQLRRGETPDLLDATDPDED